MTHVKQGHSIINIERAIGARDKQSHGDRHHFSPENSSHPDLFNLGLGHFIWKPPVHEDSHHKKPTKPNLNVKDNEHQAGICDYDTGNAGVSQSRG